VGIATSASGTLLDKQEYGPWGSIRSGSLPETTLNYTGQRRDGTGLLYYGARYYDPVLGRFLSPDSIVPGGGANSQMLNRYAYVGNNPINHTDPTGHCGREEQDDCGPRDEYVGSGYESNYGVNEGGDGGEDNDVGGPGAVWGDAIEEMGNKIGTCMCVDPVQVRKITDPKQQTAAYKYGEFVIGNYVMMNGGAAAGYSFTPGPSTVPGRKQPDFQTNPKGLSSEPNTWMDITFASSGAGKGYGVNPAWDAGDASAFVAGGSSRGIGGVTVAISDQTDLHFWTSANDPGLIFAEYIDHPKGESKQTEGVTLREIEDYARSREGATMPERPAFLNSPGPGYVTPFYVPFYGFPIFPGNPVQVPVTVAP
jgi:RHS repeat-associated protein